MNNKVKFEVRDGMMGIKWVYANDTHVASLTETIKIVTKNQTWSVKRCTEHKSVESLNLNVHEFLAQLKEFMEKEGLLKVKA